MRLFISIITFFGLCSGLWAIPDQLPFPKGEQIEYTVSWNMLPIGTMTLVFDGLTLLDGQEVYRIVSISDTSQYKGREAIYADPKTWLPIRFYVILSIWVKLRLLKKRYDSQQQTVTIIKKSGGRESQEVINGAVPLQNSILLYYWARLQKFDVKQTFPVSLPTRDYTFMVKSSKSNN